jgi:hypothetical protein
MNENQNQESEQSEKSENKDEYNYSKIPKALDADMRIHLTQYQTLSAKRDMRAELMLRRIRVNHPVFQLISLNAFKYIFENGQILQPKVGQMIYKEY